MELPDTTPPELVPFTFLVGHWTGRGVVEDWVAAGDVLFGLRFDRSAKVYEVVTLRRGESSEWLSCPTGAPCTSKTLAHPGRGLLEVTGFGFPGFAYKSVEGKGPRWSGRSDDSAQRSWAIVRSGGRGAEAVEWGALEYFERRPRRLRAGDRVAAPELEQADRVFHDAVVTGDALQAWVAAFDPEVGYQWNESAGAKVPAGPEMAEFMVGTLTGGRLDWTPTSSALAPTHDLGWTVGDWTWSATDGSVVQRGAYVTVWRRAADGSWKVWFDTGDPLDTAVDRAEPGGAG
ncbi:MAG: DUF4440 domain-containing protein [Myxococcota bacterium]